MKSRWLYSLIRLLVVLIGALLAAVGLEIFLIPNSMVDGGIIGISIILSHLTRWPLGLFIIGLNLPFLYFGYKHIGLTFTLTTLYAVVALSIFVNFLHPVPGLTNDLLLASVFGGVILGTGVGTIIRYGGSLDGTEIIAVISSKRTGFSVGEIVMFFNIFILGSAGLVFGWDRAMYSLIAYFVAFKTIDIVIEGLEENKSVTVISDHHAEIAEAILHRLGRGVTAFQAVGAYTGQEKRVLYCVVNRLELAKLKSIIHEKDPGAFVAIEHVYDVMGGRFEKKQIH